MINNALTVVEKLNNSTARALCKASRKTLLLLGSASAVFAVTTTTAQAQQTVETADSVSENFTPPLLGGVCEPNVAVVSDGDTTVQGYCPAEPVDDNYEITLTFSPSNEQAMTGLTVWANAGNVVGDSELRIFDLEVDYFDVVSGTNQTLVMNDVDIGDTTSASVPIVVNFESAGQPISIYDVTDVRISNLRANGIEAAVREIQGNFDVIDPVTVKTLSSSDVTPATGDIVTFEIEVSNNSTALAYNTQLTDLLPNGFIATGNNGNVTQGTYNSISGVWSVGTLTANSSATLTIEGEVDTGQAANTLTNNTTAATALRSVAVNGGDDLSESVIVDTTADFSVTLTNTPGQNAEVDLASDTVGPGSNTEYTLTVTNNGPDSVTGTVVNSTIVSGLTCPATNAVAISGSGVPAGSFTISDLTGSGITLGTLANGESATLTYTCEVN